MKNIVALNRTIKEKMFKYFSANNTRKFVDVLDLLVDQYTMQIYKRNFLHLLFSLRYDLCSRK